jgi:hypothetical protein
VLGQRRADEVVRDGSKLPLIDIERFPVVADD